jgi:ribokinase
MSCVLVVGCVSFDKLRLETVNRNETWQTIGGAGLYTALAAAKQGADVTLYAPRPDPMPQILAEIDRRLTWIGPHCSESEMPRLDIVHHGGGRATLVAASWGAEELLVPECLPEVRYLDFDIVHIAALSSVQKQNNFADFFNGTSDNRRLSAGTYARAITSDKSGVERLIEKCDLFFMNRNEANLLFGETADVPTSYFERTAGGSLTTAVYVTDGERGVTVNTCGVTRIVPALPADELDPTGAGDTFCGAVLATLSDRLDFEAAARKGVELAARVIEQPGPKYLLS